MLLWQGVQTRIVGTRKGDDPYLIPAEGDPLPPADRSVATRVLPRTEALSLPDIIRTQSNLIPPDAQEVQIVDIVGLDVQADGGTHVASTAQIGKVQVVNVESKGRANRRVRVRLVD
ncbi:hypothetical protein ACLQ29_13330 [Micromonospora sp. DT228]|uniref:hypothetical protein n=1 Tax=Micromonospora sp. DT228 TaxID=3393443 RepID=UPI003CF62FDB